MRWSNPSNVSSLASKTSAKEEDIVRTISNDGDNTRETVRFISAVDVRKFEGSYEQYERTFVDAPLVYRLFYQGHRRVATVRNR